ncbi:MAG: hypothetical protein H7287_05780, partial [Thermoleophilia bacterium]|nr:hypothetical protein [Thermoleophilia bacterium]
LALTAFGAAGSTRFLGAGLNSSFQVRADGTVYGTGENSAGTLATTDFVGRTAPTASTYTCGCGSFVKVVSGGFHSAGIKADGMFYMWGEDAAQQLGNGTATTSDVLTPQSLSIPSGVRTVALGRFSSMAIANDGQVYGWGQASQGQLGLSVSPTTRDVPTVIPGLAGGARDIVANYDSMAVLMADGTVMTFGNSSYGQIGNGLATGVYATPTAASGFANARSISGGRYDTYALMPDGTMKVAGQGTSGEFGNGAFSSSSTPTTVTNHFGDLDVAGGALFTISLGADGKVSSSGTNNNGELGVRSDRASTYDAPAPETVQFVASPGTQPLAVSLTTGRSHTAATTSDGLVYTWGLNNSGQLGRAGNTYAVWSVPTVLQQGAGPMLIRNITMGGYNSIALTRDGAFYTWGDNTSGQLGNGLRTSSAAPIFVSSGCAVPATPSPIDQFLANGTTSIPSGGWGSDAGVVLKFSTIDLDASETLTPWVEVTTGAFTGTCGQTSATTYSGTAVVPSSTGAVTPLSVTVPALVNLGNYNWRACVVDSANQRTAWANFPGGPPDFMVKTSMPQLPTLISPANNASTPSTTPTLTATYTDTAPVTSGTVNFAIGTSSTCGTGVQRSGDSASNIVSGNNGSWTIAPALPTGTYYWCAQNTNAAGNVSGFTLTRKLIIGAASMSITASTPSVNLGAILPSTDVVASFSADVQTDALNGYQLLATDGSDTSAMSCVCGGALPDWTGTNTTPTQWPALTTSFGGLTVRNATGGRLAKWGAGTGTAENDFSAVNRYAGLRSTDTLLHERTSYSAATDTVLMTFRIDASSSQQGGAYTTTVSLTALANP